MGRITASFFISLDGVVERPAQWHFPYFDDEMAAVVGAGTENNAAFLMGRTLPSELALTHSATHGNGVLHLTYAPA
jgi:hypothetical protein